MPASANIDFKYLLILLTLPFLVSFSTIMTRKMNGIEVMTLVFYTIVGNIVLFSSLAYFSKEEACIYESYTLQDYVMLLATAILGLLGLAAKA